MRVTIIADASYCPDTRAAGYGFWIASDRGKRGGSGAFRERVVNNIAAEMMALVNGLHTACKHDLVMEGDDVLLQTDCMAAISAFKGQRINITKEELDIVEFHKELVASVQVQVQFRHVKGHTSGKEPRLYINNKCDEFARQGMLKARAHFRKNGS